MTRVACVDIGTVTCRLAIAEVAGGRVASMSKTSTICDLGEGLAATGRIADSARARVVACVSGYVRLAAEAEVAGTCCTLTSAARDAANAADLVGDLVRLGLRPEVIPGSVEGALTFAGVAADFAAMPIVVADNGGGSTELAAGTLFSDDADVAVAARVATPCGDVTSAAPSPTAPPTSGLAFVESVDVGCRRVTERFLSADAPDAPAQVAAARAFAYAALAPAAERALAAVPDAATLVTCGGTVTSLVAIRDALVPYDSSRVHGATLAAAEVDALAARLASLSVARRAEVPGLQPKRAAVILGGALTVSELLRAFGFSSLTVSEHDLLYGLSLAAAAAADGMASPVAWLPTLASLPL